ncbi:MAG: hypothetical protein AAFX99_27435, partial [Myxococcota bacterium]
EAGFFFIRVFSNGNPNNYTLNYTLTGNGLMVPDCTNDDNEPNDTLPDATPLTLERPIEAQMCGFDVDVYSFEAGPTLGYDITLDYDRTAASLLIEVVDEMGNVMVSGPEISAWGTGPGGSFFARVVGSGADQVPYMLTLTERDLPCIDRFEPNNTLEMATPVEVGQITDVDVCLEEDPDDWFAIELPSAGDVSVTVTFDDDAADIDLELFDQAGAELDTSTGTEDTETVDATVMDATTVYVRVYVYEFSGAGSASAYDMDITFTP